MTVRPPFPTAIDSSMLSTFRACPQQFYWNYIRRKDPQGLNIHLHAGGAFASAIEVARHNYYINDLSLFKSQCAGLKELWRYYGDFDTDQAKSWHGMTRALVSYFEIYPFDSDIIQPARLGGKPAIEFSFAVPLPETTHPESGEPILLSGRADMVGDYNGSQFLVDEKTTGSLGQSWPKKWDLRGQFLGYTFAAQQHGWDVVGAIIRGVAILKTRIDHAQVIIYHPDWMLNRWLEQTARDIERMIKCWEDDYWDFDFADACTNYGGCPYDRLCKVDNPEEWLSIYYQDNTWDPLHKDPEQLRFKGIKDLSNETGNLTYP